MVMPTDEPWTATAMLLEEKRRLAEGHIHIDVALQVAVRPDLAEMAALGPISFEVFPADVGRDFLIGTPTAIRAAMRTEAEPHTASPERLNSAFGPSTGSGTEKGPFVRADRGGPTALLEEALEGCDGRVLSGWDRARRT